VAGSIGSIAERRADRFGLDWIFCAIGDRGSVVVLPVFVVPVEDVVVLVFDVPVVLVDVFFVVLVVGVDPFFDVVE
jgi:hypothetical protein